MLTMDNFSATEQAYKNGYEKGRQDAMKWIPVTERLPYEECHCLVIDEAGDIEMDYYNGKGRFVLDHSGVVQHPSHWMPLPQPPKGE